MPRLKGPPQPRPRLARRFYSIDEFCDVAGTCRASVYNGIRNGEIPFVEVVGRKKIPVSYVDSLASKAGARDPNN